MQATIKIRQAGKCYGAMQRTRPSEFTKWSYRFDSEHLRRQNKKDTQMLQNSYPWDMICITNVIS